MLLAFRAVASPGYPNDENEVATRASRTYDRSYDPNGVARQRIAWFASGDRTERRFGSATALYFGGRAYLEDPAVAERIPGYYLGSDACAAVDEIKKRLFS